MADDKQGQVCGNLQVTPYLFEKLGNIDGKLDSLLKNQTEYNQDNKSQHRAMWMRIDSHGKKINWFMGAAAVLSSLATYTFITFKHKLFGFS